MFQNKPTIFLNIFICLLAFNLLCFIRAEQTTLYFRPKLQTNLDSGKCKPPQLNTNNTFSAGNCQDSLYYIQIGIGTPPQYFYFIFDTGSFILQVPTTKTNPNGFVKNQSSTYQITSQPGYCHYAGGNYVSGFYGSDIISVLPQIAVNESLLFVEKQGNMSLPGNIIGICGMGYTTTKSNFLDLAYQAGQILTNTFALNLLGEESQSLIYYNKIPESISNSTLYSPLMTGGFAWQISVIGFYADNFDLTSYTANGAIIDSGTSSFFLNPALYFQLSTMYFQNCTNKTTPINGSGYFLCNCSQQLPKLTFMFIGVSIQLDPSDYSTPTKDGLCQVYINYLADQSNIFLLGDTIFLQYIITFDKQNAQVGFNDNVDHIDPVNNSTFNKTRQIPVIGSSDLLISQYIMFSFSILWLILSIVLICLFYCFLQEKKYEKSG